MKEIKTRKPEFYDKFSCIGPACPETCCRGWNITIDKGSYEKYKKLGDAELSGIVKEHVKRNRGEKRDEGSYAYFKLLPDGMCPFVAEDGLCALQKKHGEEILCDTCTIYPRKYFYLDGFTERSVSMSCPEVCRLALLDKEMMGFSEQLEKIDEKKLSKMHGPSLRTGDAAYDNKPQRYLAELRDIAIDIIQTRRYAFEDRLLILGMFMQKAQSYFDADNSSGIPELIAEYRRLLPSGVFDFGNFEKNPAMRLGIVFMLMEFRRKTSSMPDYAEGYFVRAFYDMLRQGGEARETTMDQLELEISDAAERYFIPYLKDNEHVFENMMVLYMFTHQFPLTKKEYSVYENFVALAAHYAVIKTMICAGAVKEKKIDDELVMRTIYSLARMQEHNSMYNQMIHDIVTQKDVAGLEYIAHLIRA